MSEALPTPGLSVLILSGSSRKGSLNAQLAQLAAQVAEKAGATVDLTTLADFDVPGYDGDDEKEDGIPPGAHEFRRRLLASDAFILVSPEYNGSMPGVVKNLIDWTSRFRPQPFDELQALLLSASPSMAGGNRGLWALRVPLEHMGTRVYPDMFSLASAHKTLVDGDIANPRLRERFDTTIQAFLSLAEAAKHYECLKRRWFEFLGETPDAVRDREEAAAPAS